MNIITKETNAGDDEFGEECKGCGVWFCSNHLIMVEQGFCVECRLNDEHYISSDTRDTSTTAPPQQCWNE